MLCASIELVLPFPGCLRHTCSPTHCPEAGDRLSPYCACDRDCGVFGDCCGSSSLTPPPSCPAPLFPPPSPGARVRCTSTFAVAGISVEGPDEAFLMLGSCPHSWPAQILAGDGRSVVSHCESQYSPLTDTSTGLVYRNEYCAICNSAAQVQGWEVAIACTASVYEALRESSLSSILQRDPDFLNRQCRACQYQPPPSSTHPPPRPCVPAIRSCLNKTALEQHLHTLSDDTYRGLVSDCLRGEMYLVKDRGGRVFHNLACSDCNAVSRDQLSCFEVREREMALPGQCIPVDTVTTTSTTSPLTTVSTTRPTTLPLKPTTLPPTTVSTATALPLTIIPPTKPATLPGPPKRATLPGPPTKPRTFPIIPPTTIPFTNPPTSTRLPFPVQTLPGATPPTTPPQEAVDPSPENIVDPVGIPFTITLSGLGGGGVSIVTETDTYQVSVECPEGEVPVGLECRPTQCPQSYSVSGGRCLLHSPPPSPPPDFNSSSDNDSNCSLSALERGEYVTLGNDSVLFHGEEVLIMGEDEEGNLLVCANISSTNASFLDCPTRLLPLNQSEFEELGNRTILYDNQTLEVMFYDDQGRPLVCPGNTSFVVEVEVNKTIVRLLPGIAELTFIGCSLSVLGSAALLFTHALFRELRTFPSFLLVNLSSAILLTNLLFIVGGPVVQQFPGADLCTTVAICLHFSYLAQFAWMSLFSFQMVHTFHLTRKMVVASERRKGWGIPLVCMLIGWGLPLGVTLVAVGINFGSSEELVLYGVTDDGSVRSCWINHFLSFVLLFLVPLLLSLTLNLAMFLTVSVFLCQLSRTKSSSSKGHSKHAMLIRVWLAFFSVTGLTWVFGFLAIPNETSWAWYPFVVFNSTQGFSIFLAFLLTRKTLRLYAGLLTGRRRERGGGETRSGGTTRTLYTSKGVSTLALKTSELTLRAVPSQLSLASPHTEAENAI